MPPAANQFSGIFICYRRDDSAGYARALFERLAAHFGDDQIFMDLDQIEPGEDFVQAIENAVGSCGILIALIGRNWLTSRDETGRRLDNPKDFVCLEISAALQRNIRVIPVLVQGATMPRPQDLPDELSQFSQRQALELSDKRWKHDIGQLIVTLKKVLNERETRQREEELERQRAEEAERNRRVAEERLREPAVEVGPVQPSVTKPAPKSNDTVIILVGALLLLVMVITAVLWFGEDDQHQSGTGAVPVEKHLQAYVESINGATLEMVAIPGGRFVMGAPESEAKYEPVVPLVGGPPHNVALPMHVVTVPAFYMSKYEVTQAQWRAVMGNNPSRFQGDNLPVENVSYYDALEFCGRLSHMTQKLYEMPSEAQWEYAARAGTTSPFAFGSSLSSDQASFNGEAPYGGAPKGIKRTQTMPVGYFKPNAFGLYDMHGNVWEWCQDHYHENYLDAPDDGSAWMTGGSSTRVLRGGAWDSPATNLRSAYRIGLESNSRNDSLTHGFRVVAVVK